MIEELFSWDIAKLLPEEEIAERLFTFESSKIRKFSLRLFPFLNPDSIIPSKIFITAYSLWIRPPVLKNS